jgi:hypothetical protein
MLSEQRDLFKIRIKQVEIENQLGTKLKLDENLRIKFDLIFFFSISISRKLEGLG